MYKILVVDDEPISVQSIVYMIEKNFNEAGLIETSNSGRSAIEKAQTFYPDIVVMDIQMQGINGLQAIKQIKEYNPNISFIILSAFDYFDYAKEAISLGVEDYLLKPVNEAKFIQALTEVFRKYSKKRELRSEILEHQERLEMITPILETDFIESFCTLRESGDELKKIARILGHEETRGYVMVIEFGEEAGKSAWRLLRSFYDCIVGPVTMNRIVVYVFDQQKINTKIQKTVSLQIAQKFRERAREDCQEIYVGIGSFCEDVSSANASYRKALQALKFILHNKEVVEPVLHSDDMITNEKNVGYKNKEFIEKIYETMIRRDEKAVRKEFDEHFLSLTNSCCDINSIKNQIIELIIELGKRLSIILMDSVEFFQQITQAQDANSLRTIVNNFLIYNLQHIDCNQNSKTNEVIQKANDYIDQHFSEQIMLKDVAKEVNLSIYYFSHFYKQETGMNFSDKLSKVRIEKAKEFLTRNDCSVKEVSSQVGYLESTYFSKIFKKMTGYTPGEYKKAAESLE